LVVFKSDYIAIILMERLSAGGCFQIVGTAK
jgi:hypothetical protein